MKLFIFLSSSEDSDSESESDSSASSPPSSPQVLIDFDSCTWEEAMKTY